MVPDSSASESDRRELDFLGRVFQISRIIRGAADLALADRVETAGSRTVVDLAGECAVEAATLLRLFRTLAAFGIFRVSVDGTVAHSRRSLLLRSDGWRREAGGNSGSAFSE